MAYDWKNIFDQSLRVIEENPINTIEDLICFLPCSKSSFYEHFAEDSDELDAIKKAVDKRKVERKSRMRNNWEKSDNATLQVAAYKLAANDEELERLSVNVNKNHNTGEMWVIQERSRDEKEDSVLSEQETTSSP